MMSDMKKRGMKRILERVLVYVSCVMIAIGMIVPIAYAGETESTSEVVKSLQSLVEQAEEMDVSAANKTSRALFDAAISAAKAGLADSDLTDKKAELLSKALVDISNAMILEEQDGVIFDGTYEIKGQLKHATSDQASMGNEAIQQPMTLVAEDGQLTLRFHSVPLTAGSGKMKFTGYLGFLTYFPDYTGTSVPSKEKGVRVTEESYYDTYDAYNDPKTGTDKQMKGKKYPEWYSMTVSPDREMYWVQVYVPVMEGISGGTGGGYQYARFELDWSSLTQTGGTPTNKTALKAALKNLQSLQKKVSAGDQVTDEDILMLAKAVKYGTSASGNINIDQDTVDKVTTALKSIYQVYQYTEPAKEDSGKDENDKDKNQDKDENTGDKSQGESDKTSDSDGQSGKTKNGKLDFMKLKDGTYSITGEMVKIDRKTASMSNNAINHTIKLTVKNGEYKLTLNFCGLNVNNQKGYLGTLWYFKSGYKTDKTGAPKGSVSAAAVESVQKDSNGKVIKDSFGTNYPDKVTFPVIKEAKSDGYCPLRVFVPIMESISAGTGTQPVYLKIKRSSVKAVSAKATVFDQENTGEAVSGTGSGGTGMQLSGGSSLGGLGSGLGTLGEGGDTLQSGLEAADGTNQVTSQTSDSGASTPAEEEKVPPLRDYVVPGAETIGGLGALILLYLKRRIVFGMFI